MRALSLVATVPGTVREGIPSRYNRKLRCRVVPLDNRAIVVDRHNPPMIHRNRIHEADYQYRDNTGPGRLVHPKNPCTKRILLWLVLPKEHEFKGANHKRILLRNTRPNSVGLIMVAEPGLLIRVVSKRLDLPHFVYVNEKLEVLFDEYDGILHAGGFR